MRKKYIVPVCQSIPMDFESLLVEISSGNGSNINNYQHVNFNPGKSGDSNASDNQDYSDYEN